MINKLIKKDNKEKKISKNLMNLKVFVFVNSLCRRI